MFSLKNINLLSKDMLVSFYYCFFHFLLLDYGLSNLILNTHALEIGGYWDILISYPHSLKVWPAMLYGMMFYWGNYLQDGVFHMALWGRCPLSLTLWSYCSKPLGVRIREKRLNINSQDFASNKCFNRTFSRVIWFLGVINSLVGFCGKWSTVVRVCVNGVWNRGNKMFSLFHCFFCLSQV